MMDTGLVPLVDLYYKQNKATQTDLLLSYPDIVNQLLQDLTQKLLVMSHSDTLNSTNMDDILNDGYKTDNKINTGDKNVIYSEIKRPKDKIKVARGKVKSLQNHFEQLSSSAIICDESLTPCSRSRLPSSAAKLPIQQSGALLSPKIVSSLSKRFQPQANIDDSHIRKSTLVGDDSTTSTPAVSPAQLFMTKKQNPKQQSNITLYEDVDDVFQYLDEKPFQTIYASPVFANLPPSPPPRPRLFTTNTTACKRSALLRKKRKNLASHLGLDSLSASTIDIANAQKIALENMQKSSTVINSKKKDLNKFLGLNESMNSSVSIPVKLREKKQRRHSVSNTSSFMDNLKSNKLFKISSRKSENILNSSHLKEKKLRRNLLEDLSLEDSGFEKSRTSSFSSVKSSTTTSSSITETSEDEYLSGFSANNFRGFSTDLTGGFSNYNGSNYSSGSDSLGLPLIPFTPPPSNINLTSPQRRKSGFEIFSDYCSMDVAASMLNTAAAQRRRSMSLSANCQYDKNELSESGENDVYVEMRRQQIFTNQEYVTKSLVI